MQRSQSCSRANSISLRSTPYSIALRSIYRGWSVLSCRIYFTPETPNAAQLCSGTFLPNINYFQKLSQKVDSQQRSAVRVACYS